MGYGITAVCTVAAYTYTYTEYGYSLGNFGFAGIVSGGNCSFTLDTFTGDAGSLVEIFNVTSAGQMTMEDIHCNISTSLGCNTNYAIFTGLPYQEIFFEFETLNASGTFFAKNFSYFMLPPVPSQPPAPILINGSTQVIITTSLYSVEYGSALTGCLVAAGPNVWFPSNIPTTLSSTASQNSLPYTSYAIYQPAQNTNYTVNLADMNLSPNTTYDIWAMCYNGNGQGPHSILFNQTTPSTLPIPKPANNGGEAGRGQVGWLVAGLMAAGVAILAM